MTLRTKRRVGVVGRYRDLHCELPNKEPSKIKTTLYPRQTYGCIKYIFGYHMFISICTQGNLKCIVIIKRPIRKTAQYTLKLQSNTARYSRWLNLHRSFKIRDIYFVSWYIEVQTDSLIEFSVLGVNQDIDCGLSHLQSSEKTQVSKELKTLKYEYLNTI